MDAIAAATTLDEALRAALVALCGNRPELLAHAVRAAEPRLPLRPLGILCGQEASAHAVLGATLMRLHPPGTGLTRSAIRQRQPVWVSSIAESTSFVRRDLLVRHGIRSGAGFPVAVGSKMAVVIELFSFGRLESDPTLMAAAAVLTAELRAATRRH